MWDKLLKEAQGIMWQKGACPSVRLKGWETRHRKGSRRGLERKECGHEGTWDGPGGRVGSYWRRGTVASIRPGRWRDWMGKGWLVNPTWELYSEGHL